METGRAVCGSPAAQDSAFSVKWLHRRNDRFVTAGNFHLRVWQVDVSIPKVSEEDRLFVRTVRRGDTVTSTRSPTNPYIGDTVLVDLYYHSVILYWRRLEQLSLAIFVVK